VISVNAIKRGVGLSLCAFWGTTYAILLRETPIETIQIGTGVEHARTVQRNSKKGEEKDRTNKEKQTNNNLPV